MTAGWTSHGHPIAGMARYGERPAEVMRCGGPRLCATCAREAAQQQGGPDSQHERRLRAVISALANPTAYAGRQAAFSATDARLRWQAQAVLAALSAVDPDSGAH